LANKLQRLRQTVAQRPEHHPWLTQPLAVAPTHRAGLITAMVAVVAVTIIVVMIIIIKMIGIKVMARDENGKW